MTDPVKSSAGRPDAARGGTPFFVAATLVTAVACAIVLLAPLTAQSSASGTATSDGTSTTVEVREGRASLLEREGAGLIALLAVPVLVCAVPLLVPRRRRRAVGWGGAAVLGAGALLGLLSVGCALVPGVVLLAVGAARSGPNSPERGGSTGRPYLP